MTKKLTIFFILLAHFILLSHLAFTAWPDMLGYPFLFSHGFRLYTDFVYPYPPILVVVLSAVYGIFGYSVMVLKIFTWTVILAEDLVMLSILDRLVKKEFSKWCFWVSFILIMSFLDGNMLWFDNALVLPLLLGFRFFLNWLESFSLRDLFWLVISLCVAADIKQTAVFYLIIPLAAMLIYNKLNLKGLRSYLAAVAVIKLPILLYLIGNKATSDFLLWLFYYPSIYWTKFPGYVDLNLTRSEIITLILLLIPLAGLLVKLRINKPILLYSSFLAISVLTVYPRFSFFHLQPFLAFTVIGFVLVWRGIRFHLNFYYLFFVLIISLIIAARSFKEFASTTRFFSSDQLIEADLIDKYSSPNDRVYLLGFNSSDYVFADRLPPKDWTDNFGWYFEIPGVQDKALQGMRLQPPVLILRRIPNPGPWYEIGVYEPKKIVNYVTQNYHEVLVQGNIEVWLRK